MTRITYTVVAVFAAALLAPPAVAEQPPGYGSTGQPTGVLCVANIPLFGKAQIVLRSLDPVRRRASLTAYNVAGEYRVVEDASYINGILEFMSVSGNIKAGVWPYYIRGSFTSHEAGGTSFPDLTYHCNGSTANVTVADQAAQGR